MTEKTDPELTEILARVFPGGAVLTQVRLNGGVSARATLVELVQTDGALKRIVVRRPWHATREGAVAVARREHALLTRCGALSILAPVPCFLDEHGAAVGLEFVDGAPDFAPLNLHGMLEQMAAQLAQIHRAPVDSHLAMLEPRRQSAARQIAFRAERPDTTLNEVELRRTVSELWPFAQINRDVLLHGDYWPGNLLFDGGQLSRVLDWEEAELGDPLADVALTRLDLLWAFGDDAAEAFTTYYRQHSSIDWTNLARWELCIALRPLGQLAIWASSYQGPPISRADITEASMAEGHRRFVASALARL